MESSFDLIAIGGGSGGLAVAKQAAQLGQRVAMIEPYALGGTCVNQGCVPKKIMWYAAHLAEAIHDAAGYGLSVTRRDLDWSALVSGRNRYVTNINQSWEKTVINHGITLIRGHAHFIDAHRIDVNGTRYHAPHIVLATGGRPAVPAVPGTELGVTSDGFFQLTTQPRRVAIVGGGYIGVELAGIFQALGSQVTLLIRGQRVLPSYDFMMSDVLLEEMTKHGINVLKNQNVTALEEGQSGTIIHVKNDAPLTGFDCVIWATGRRANTDDLNLAAAGVTPNSDGTIGVDAFQNTTTPGVYAIGDVTGNVPLTPVAIAAGRRLALRLFAGKTESKVDYDNVPSVVFSHPPVGMIGLTEDRAEVYYGSDALTVYTTRFKPMRHALSARPVTTAIKLICAGVEEKIVGLHIIGESADEILQGFAVAITMGATKSDFDRTIAIHPTIGEELVTMKQASRRIG